MAKVSAVWDELTNARWHHEYSHTKVKKIYLRVVGEYLEKVMRSVYGVGATKKQANLVLDWQIELYEKAMYKFLEWIRVRGGSLDKTLHGWEDRIQPWTYGDRVKWAEEERQRAGELQDYLGSDDPLGRPWVWGVYTDRYSQLSKQRRLGSPVINKSFGGVRLYMDFQ
jgi:hypothetical protein